MSRVSQSQACQQRVGPRGPRASCIILPGRPRHDVRFPDTRRLPLGPGPPPRAVRLAQGGIHAGERPPAFAELLPERGRRQPLQALPTPGPQPRGQDRGQVSPDPAAPPYRPQTGTAAVRPGDRARLPRLWEVLAFRSRQITFLTCVEPNRPGRVPERDPVCDRGEQWPRGLRAHSHGR